MISLFSVIKEVAITMGPIVNSYGAIGVFFNSLNYAHSLESINLYASTNKLYVYHGIAGDVHKSRGTNLLHFCVFLATRLG
jgi:sorbitol-specific phosphotransferase system component IIC